MEIVHIEETLVGDETIGEICLGMIYASLAITDNKKDTLKKIGETNPWHVEALRIITGSEKEAQRPLRLILSEDMDLTLDCIIDVTGITKGGHFLDTQGYIAHNNDVIVLSYRCTTSGFDWMTNFNATTSAWEVEHDVEEGYSGLCSGFEGLCCHKGEYKPRVHTGFYNNFLATLPLIQKHIEPRLASWQRPRKLYVVGHSLGAGIATMAGCYFLQKYDWTKMEHTLINATYGSPRACCESMKVVMDKRRMEMGNKARMYRVVKGQDIVTTVPPKLFGFRHLVDPIVIWDDGRVVLKHKSVQNEPETDLVALSRLHRGHECVLSADLESDGQPTSYDRMIARVPKALRDHMPDFYLKPLFKANGIKLGSPTSCLSHEDDGVPTKDDDVPKKALPEETKRGRPRKVWIPKMFRKRVEPVGPELHW